MIEPQFTTEQHQFTRVLDTAEGALTGLLRLILGLVIAAIVAVMGFVFIRRPFGAGNQGEYFYFTIAALLALSWAGGQFIRLDRRRKWDSLPASLRTSTADGITTWEFRLGGNPADASTPQAPGTLPQSLGTAPQAFQSALQSSGSAADVFGTAPPFRANTIFDGDRHPESHGTTREVMRFGTTQERTTPIATLPGDVVPNDETLRRLEQELARGTPVDLACELIQPAFRTWSGMQRWAYAQLVETLLKQRQDTVGTRS